MCLDMKSAQVCGI